MVGGAKQLVGAGAPFSPLRFGLLSAASEIPDPTPHWRNGTIVRHDSCSAATATSFICPPGTGSPKVAAATGAASDTTAAEPFTVVAWLPCAPIGQGPNLADLRARTERLLDRAEGRAVEEVFWTGVAGTYTVSPHLAEDTAVTITEGAFVGISLQTAATVVSGSPVSVVEGLGLLEGALSDCYGGEGIIHVPRSALARLSQTGMVRAEGPQLRTLGGNVVAAYSSNSREGPTGAVAGAGLAWFYATGMVWYRRSPMTTPGTSPGSYVGRADNTTVYVAERSYVFDWDCCHFAAQVTLGGA